MSVYSKVIVLSLLLLCVCLSYVCAIEVPEHPKGRITDFTNTLSPNEISYLDQKLADYEKQTTNQIAVLIIPSLEGDNLVANQFGFNGKIEDWRGSYNILWREKLGSGLSLLTLSLIGLYLILLNISNTNGKLFGFFRPSCGGI